MIRKNIIANIIGRAWGFISVYLFVPLYLKFLGIEAYGLVGFYSTLLGVLAFADMGFTATLNREMARLSVQEDSAEDMRNLLRTYEATYAVISLLLSLSLWISAPFIAEYWLQSKTLPLHEITAALRLMGIAIALQLPSGLYIGGLMGLQRQVHANYLQILWGVVRGLGAVLVLWLFSQTILAFALWQLIANAIYCLFSRIVLWRVLSLDSGLSQPQFKWQVFRDTWRYAAGMTGMALNSILLTQTDKLVVSKMLPLEMLGYYSLAGSIAMIPLTLASPIVLAVFPRITGLIAMEDRTELIQLYHRTSELVAVIIIPAGLTIAIFAADLIFVWTGSVITAQRTGIVTSLLLGGQLLQAITVVPFYLALAFGNVRLNLQIGVVSIILITPLLYYLIKNYGIEGAGFSWLFMNILTIPPYMYLLHRRFIPDEFRRWCLSSVGRPVLAVMPCLLLGYMLVPHESSRVLTLCFIFLVWCVATASSILISSELRQWSFEMFNKLLVFSSGVKTRGDI